ncbi:RNA-directed RNA polymerase L [Frankliniella fusca]|uniref:RNA-directed RNA polymerase L n=1 Tax=Frankliniella fusca TaxID=407009 RepID=A0AAE1HKS7_9NEOP|nr:RNA-directed RNA polymerase L [Frankliniella fusca]
MRGKREKKTYLVQQLTHHSVPLFGLPVEGAVASVGYEFECVVEAKYLGDLVDEIDAIAFELGVSLDERVAVGPGVVRVAGQGFDVDALAAVQVVERLGEQVHRVVHEGRLRLRKPNGSGAVKKQQRSRPSPTNGVQLKSC